MPQPFIPVDLQTKDGKFVATIEIPPFITPPTVLIWGERVFTLNLDLDAAPILNDGKLAYDEAEFVYYVPPDIVGSTKN